jgi:hypothetical protein
VIGRASRWRREQVALLFVVCLSTALPSTSGAQSPKPFQRRHQPAFPLFGLVGLPGDHFLLWEGSGQMQIGTSAGEWTGVFRVPFRPVHSVVSDAQGILLGGALAPEVTGALLVNLAGQEIGRWLLADDVFAVRVEAGARFATTPSGVVPLLAGGVVGAPRPFVGADLSRFGDPPQVLRDEPSAMVTCRLPNWSMSMRSPPPVAAGRRTRSVGK